MSQTTKIDIPGEHSLILLNDLLSKEECRKLIDIANNMEDDDKNKSWHKSSDTGGHYMCVIMVDDNLAQDLWKRIKKFLPSTYNRYKLVYLNNYFRFSKYKEHGVFPIHCDGTNYDGNHLELTSNCISESLFTLNIFLNDDESETEPLLTGGETDFFNENNEGLSLRYSVKPKTGRAALFWSNQYHRGNIVEDGCKYLLRTDVMGYMP